MDVYVKHGEKLTEESPMPYRSCRDFVAQMRAGDKIDFKVGSVSAGTFSVSDLPNNDAILLLVIYRHDTLTTAVSFKSHVFANLLNAQVAIIDTYKGTLHAVPRIMDVAQDTHGTARHSEELRFNSVVALKSGIYEVELHEQGGGVGSMPLKAPLVALNRESYVVLRTGVEAQQGPSFPEELSVYPKSDPSRLVHSGTAALAGVRPLGAEAKECRGGQLATCQCVLSCDIFGGVADRCLDDLEAKNAEDALKETVQQVIEETLRRTRNQCDAMKCVVECSKQLECLDTAVKDRCRSVNRNIHGCEAECEDTTTTTTITATRTSTTTTTRTSTVSSTTTSTTFTSSTSSTTSTTTTTLETPAWSFWRYGLAIAAACFVAPVPLACCILRLGRSIGELPKTMGTELTPLPLPLEDLPELRCPPASPLLPPEGQ